jgi:lambda family phage tail tape measure protein
MARAPRIAIDLEANVAGLITDMRQASQAVTNFTSNAKRDVANANRQVEQLSKGFKALGTFIRTSFAGIATTTLLSTLTGLSDRYQNLDSKLRLVTKTQAEYAIAQAGTRRIARETFASLESTTLLYQRTQNSLEGLGVSQNKVLKITETINRAFLVSGATSEEASASIVQLTQSLGSGYLRGQEFNSIAEQAPVLLKLIASSMHVPLGALKSLANQGKITRDVMVEAFTGMASEELANKAALIPLTVNRAFGLVRNAALIFVGETAKSSGAAADLANSIKFVAENFATLASAAVTLTKVGIIVWFARLAAAAKEYGAVQIANIRNTVAWSAAIAEDALRTGQAAASKATAMLAEQRAMAANNLATQEAIAFAREEQIAKLQSANATLRQAEATIAATKAIGVQSAALRELRIAEAAAMEASIARKAALNELAILGAQSARTSGIGVAGASAGKFTQAEIAAINTGMQAMLINGAKLGMVTGIINKIGAGLSALVGGPVGLAVIAIYGLYKVFDMYGERVEAARKHSEDFKNSLAEVVKTANFLTKNTSGTASDWIEQYFGSAVTINAKREEIAKLEKDLKDLYQLQSTMTGGDGAASMSIAPQIEATQNALMRMKSQFAPAQQAFASMGNELRARLGPSFDEVRKAAQTMNEVDFQKFLSSLSTATQEAIGQLNALQKKLMGISAGMGDSVIEMQRQLRDTGLNAASKARNHIFDLIEDGKKAFGTAGPVAKKYFDEIAAHAKEYVTLAGQQEDKEKSIAAATKARSAATRELNAAQKKAAADQQAAESYLGSAKARGEELQIELRTGENLGAARRELIKFDYLLERGENAYMKAQEGTIRATLEANVALEQQIVARKHAVEAAQRLQQVQRAIDDYNESRAKASQREILAIQHGGNTAELNARLQAVSDEFRQQRRSIDDNYNTQLSNIPLDDFARRNELQREYEALIGRTTAAEAMAAMKERQYLADRIAAQADWKNGAISALEDYMAEANDIAGQTKDVFNRAFKGMEDLIVQFVMTGKANFADFAKAVIADFVRMEARILLSKVFEFVVGWAMNAWGSSSSTSSAQGVYGTGSSGDSTPFAKGAAFHKGSTIGFAGGGAFTNSIASRSTTVPMATFGEAGEEAIMPLAKDSSGALGVKATGGGSGSVVANTTINVHVDAKGNSKSNTTSDSNDALARQLAGMIEGKVQEGISQAIRPGGQIYKMKSHA